MFESLTIQATSTITIVTAELEGNPFKIEAVVMEEKGKFAGASYLEVRRNGEFIDARAHCSDYGIEHLYKGPDAPLLDALCKAASEGIEEKYGIRFLSRQIDH